MWNSKKYILGLFVAMNQGNIVDCHGTLSDSSVRKLKKKYIHPFCAQDMGTIENVNESQIENDKQSAEIEEAASAEEAIKDNVIEIHTAEQLLEISKQVNLGDSFYCNGNYRLLEDLDLQNKRWIPIGTDELTPFCGSFDGNGHAIKNLFVKGNREDCAGFFGFLKRATVCNLSVEGTIKGGKYMGAITGVSEDSTITSCFASAKIYGSYCAGGFVGKNTGKILHCYFSGTVQHKRI